MAQKPPSASAMFSNAETPLAVAEQYESFNAELTKALSIPRPHPRQSAFAEQSNAETLQKALGSAEIAKALSPELVDSVRNALAQSSIGKEWTVGTGSNGNPVPSGLVAFDLEAPSKMLTPHPTPLRNRIPRRKGIGSAHRFKVISGFTGTGTGGAGIFHPGITEAGVANSTQFSQGGFTPMRGATISYDGYDQAVNYHTFGVSDSVSWQAEFSGQGFQDVRQLSQTALLWSSMLLEERMLLAGRGTDSNFIGAIVPTFSLSAAAAGSGQTAVANSGANCYVAIVGHGIYGTGAITSTSGVAFTSGTSVVTVNITNANSTAALSYDIYVGFGSSAPAAGSMWLAASGVTASQYVLQGTIPSSGTSASGAPSSDTSAYAAGYDGILSYTCGPNAGYVDHINSTLSTTNPGNEFNVAFASLYDSVKADPDEILANGHDRKQLSDTLKSASGNGYRINLEADAHNATLGTMVTSIQNEITGKIVNVTVHPWLPQGTMPIISWALPIPDSQVSDVFAAVNVTDYMGIEWPVIQYLYESSSYWLGTFICYAPAWCGSVMGVTAA